MIVDTLLAKVIGTANDRELKRLRPYVAEINAKEPEIQTLTDEQLRAKTAGFRERLAKGEALGETEKLRRRIVKPRPRGWTRRPLS